MSDNSFQTIRRLFTGTLLILALSTFLASTHGANVVLWDTTKPLTDQSRVGDQSGWKIVPSNLFTLEKDPPKASSDPGYYGRDYVFQGDAVVANQFLIAAFSGKSGRIQFYSKSAGAAPLKAFELGLAGGRSAEIASYEVVRNVADEVVLKIVFTGGSSQEHVTLTFGKGEIVEIKPGPKLGNLMVTSVLDYGIVPSFIGDDLIYHGDEKTDESTVAVPVENMFLGLVKGEESMLVMTWPQGKQQLRLKAGLRGQKKKIEGFEFDHAGQSFYFATLRSPGIWHREELKPAYLEKEISTEWKRPFPARWVTQLAEAGVKTTFTFREGKGQIWRGVPGSYNYPVWFNGDHAVYLLNKKVPPKGESIIYFREGENTPLSILTPVDVLRETLGRPFADAILDPPGRKLRTHHKGGSGVHRACTCGYTEAIQAVFEKGEEIQQKKYIASAVDDMIYFVQMHLERIDEYRKFAGETIGFLNAKQAASPELKDYVEPLKTILQQIDQEYHVQLVNMKSLGHADELSKRTMALTSKNEPGNLAAYMNLLKEWRAMGGAQDYVVAQCHSITRKFYQEAGYACASQPKAVELAQEIRKRTRACLRNPDGYEIWPDY